MARMFTDKKILVTGVIGSTDSVIGSKVGHFEPTVLPEAIILRDLEYYVTTFRGLTVKPGGYKP